MLRTRYFLAPGIFVLAMASGTRAFGQTITEFPIPTAFNTAPYDIAAGPDGNVWFTDVWPQNPKIGRITPAGVITEFPLALNDGLGGIAAGPDGNLWYTKSYAIGRITPAGVITDFPIPTPFAEPPQKIAAGPDGNLWYTRSYAIGRITPAGVVTEFLLPPGGGNPDGIAQGPDGNLWFAQYNQIGRITPNGHITEFPISTANAGSRGIAAGPDGNLWFTEYGASKIGRITPAGVVTEFPLPTLGSSPEGIATGPDGNIWFAESQYVGSQIGRITPTGVITEFPTPTPHSMPVGIATGPDGNLWFTELSANRIGRLTKGLVLGSGRFVVKTIWQSPEDSGEGYGIALTPDTGYFWFFSSTNVELIVKVLDGCALNSTKWVFAGGLTNVKVVLTVTDTQTGAVRTYINPQGTSFRPIQDTSAFSACP